MNSQSIPGLKGDLLRAQLAEKGDGMLVSNMFNEEVEERLGTGGYMKRLFQVDD